MLFDTENGTILPATNAPFKTSKTNFQPRVSATWAPGASRKTVVRGGFGLVVGPGQTEDQIQPIESDRISSTLSGHTSQPVAIRHLTLERLPRASSNNDAPS